ncbi:WecB/TagA/CpsF family glycosyltransferase [Candidatus Gottesmanbacteria bacterium]|nr:WecB/TagA/CpsF family glycosyltransferase [Candidatus Gottesmanbacteria bacterium]
MKTTNKIPVLGVGISQTSFKNALETVEKRLRDHHTTKTYFIATPNPEMLVLASYNKQFKQILNRADLAIPDGIGLIWASKFLRLTKILGKGDFLTERIAGTDLMLKLCNLAAKKGYTSCQELFAKGENSDKTRPVTRAGTRR